MAFRDRTLIAPIARFVTEEHIRTLLILFSAIVFVFFTTKDYIPFAARLAVPFLLILLIATDDMRHRFTLLLWITLGLALNVVMNFYVIANHGFVITYIGIALMVACASGDNASRNVSRAAVFLISILMGLALIQKLISAHYMSGDLIGSYLANGYMFKTLISLVDPNWPQTVHANLAAQKALMGMAPAAQASVAVTIPPMIQVLAIILTWLALASQVMIEACVLARKKLGVWAHYAIMLFVLIIYSTRNENVFLSMNLILGYAITDENTKSVRLWYVIGIAYLMIMEAMGLRPGIIG
ncbi:hypothetical protein [Amylibacter sp. IMCC11727]|uniref:hypothetical protein n=1 Tax=Amylibacter sp. IMCC11727 TaxID=3039851 RepID=UPI00244DA602|nr:hypothetical protein [Amylibacter sp. IMCC11727]WGI20944.1 hypothetical protein QBD29_12590 [Amylibacter sp. IMCC11727]